MIELFKQWTPTEHKKLCFNLVPRIQYAWVISAVVVWDLKQWPQRNYKSSHPSNLKLKVYPCFWNLYWSVGVIWTWRPQELWFYRLLPTTFSHSLEDSKLHLLWVNCDWCCLLCNCKQECINPLTTDDTIWCRLILAACYQLGQSVLKIDFVLAKKAG